jgi:hypothetical protein
MAISRRYFVGLELDTFAVMPNHDHGIVVLRNSVGAGLKPALHSKDTQNGDEPATSAKRAYRKQRGPRTIHRNHLRRGLLHLPQLHPDR